MRDHRHIDQRSLAFGRLLAAQIRQRPELIERARATLHRWLADCSPRTRASLEQWQVILSGPLDGVIAILTGGDEQAVRLRQSNPFAGVLSLQQRNQILRQFQSHDTPAA
jgi:hypothetical protein